MKSALFFSLLPSLLGAYLAQGQLDRAALKKTDKLPIVANKFMIEVDDLATLNRRDFARSLDAVYHDLRARDVEFQVTKEFDTAGIFTGAAIVISDINDVATIEQTPAIKAIRPIREFQRPRVFDEHTVSGPQDPKVPVAPQSTHILGGVDKIHAEGNKGKGIKIGIIDSGIDYLHPNLGGGFGKGFKVAYGYDFVGDAYNGRNKPVPDDDPMDCGGHGTHVAGIIGASGANDFKMFGVAPDAILAGYRVFGCSGSVTEDVLVDALLRGVKDGMDILTLSLGGADGWATSSSAIVANRIALQGKIVTIAAGNDGDEGSWYSSSPGNSPNAISVASIDNTHIPLQNATVIGASHPGITYFNTLPLPIEGELPVYLTSRDATIADDACAALPDNTPDLSGYLVLVRRGSCTFVQKLQNIASKGAKQALIYDNGSGFASISVGEFQAALIQAQDGEFLVNEIVAGKEIKLSFPKDRSTSYPDAHGGLVSDFSSYGPSNDFKFKPAVAAPGGKILSTIPRSQGSWGVKSGTSMATPYVAGTSALLLVAKGRSPQVARDAKTLFETTANPVPISNDGTNVYHTLSQVGAGHVNIYKAIHSTVTLSRGELILNDTANFVRTHTINIKNNGRTIKTFKASHLAAETSLTVKPNSQFPALGPVPGVNAPAGVTIFPSVFTLFPGQSLPVFITFTPPAGVDKSLYPLYSGFISFKSGSESYHASYIGLANSLKSKGVIDNTNTHFSDIKVPAILDKDGDVQSAPTNYTFSGVDWPGLVWRLTFGTPALRIDLVDAAIDFKPTLSRREPEPGPGGFPWFPIFTFPHLNQGGSYARVKVLGSLASFDYAGRHDENDDPERGNAYSILNLRTPTYSNGTAIRNGAYRILMRALKVTGDPKKQEDYESWLSPIIGVNSGTTP